MAARSPVLSLLIAGHHEVVRYGLRKILERQSGWGVIAEAGDGKEAVSKAIETEPDVAILDYGMHCSTVPKQRGTFVLVCPTRRFCSSRSTRMSKSYGNA